MAYDAGPEINHDEDPPLWLVFLLAAPLWAVVLWVITR